MHFLLKMEMFHCHVSLPWLVFGLGSRWDFFSPARQQRLPRRVCHHDTHHKVRVRVRCAKSMKQRMESCRYCYTWTFSYLPNHCQGPWELPSTTSGFPFQKLLEQAFYPLPIFETSPSPQKRQKTKKNLETLLKWQHFLSWRMNPQTSFVKNFSEFIGSCSTFFLRLNYTWFTIWAALIVMSKWAFWMTIFPTSWRASEQEGQGWFAPIITNQLLLIKAVRTTLVSRVVFFRG